MKRTTSAKKSTATKKSANSKSSANSSAKKTATKKASSPSRGTAKKSSGAKSSSAEDLEKVFKDLLKDIYYAEKKLHKALGKMARAANNEELKNGFETHKQETEEQIGQLERVFEIMGMRAQGKKCPAMDGLTEEGSEAIEEFDKGPARDAALIASAQKAEHYEISTYGTLRAFAEVMGEEECATIFENIMEQESATDEKLTNIARTVNEEAMAESEEMEMA